VGREAQMVADFHEFTRTPMQPLHYPNGPKWPGPGRDQLRLHLIEEEAKELREAILAEDLVAVADALADLKYVIHGAELEFGIDGDETFAEVHRSNMTKAVECEECQGMRSCVTCNDTGLKVLYREDGKILKPPTFSPPNLAAVLYAQGWRPDEPSEIAG
jgi:NTP pyrophosphatase (non-canonical NTP hydrolase)